MDLGLWGMLGGPFVGPASSRAVWYRLSMKRRYLQVWYGPPGVGPYRVPNDLKNAQLQGVRKPLVEHIRTDTDHNDREIGGTDTMYIGIPKVTRSA